MIKASVNLVVLSGLLLSFTSLAAEPAAPAIPAEVMVNGQPISAANVELMMSTLSAGKDPRAIDNEEDRNAARKELISQEVMAQAALKKGLDKSPMIADQFAFDRRSILSRAYIENHFAENPITDEVLKNAYEWNKANGKIMEYQVRHILVSSKDKAADLIQQLKKGGDFVELAKHHTTEPGGAQQGGALMAGDKWFRPDIFVDNHFADAVMALKKGQYTDTPVRSRFGWHVIKVDDGPRPVANPGTYDMLSDEVKDALRQKTAQRNLTAMIDEVMAGAKITTPGKEAALAPARQ